MSSHVEFEPHHCGISVPDVKASTDWYCNTLGFSVAQHIDIEGAKIVFLKHGNFFIELFEVAGASPLPDNRKDPRVDIRTHGTKHIAFRVKDLVTFVDGLKKRNVDIAMDIITVDKFKAAFIRDNAGMLLEFLEET